MYYAILAMKPGHKAVITDVCVPVSKLNEMVVETQKDIKASGILGELCVTKAFPRSSTGLFRNFFFAV